MNIPHQIPGLSTPVDGVDKAALLFALGFPCAKITKVTGADLNSQTGRRLSPRLSWHFSQKSQDGRFDFRKVSQGFVLPERNAAHINIFQRARIAASNYHVLKRAAIENSQLGQINVAAFTLLRNESSAPVPMMEPAPGMVDFLPAIAIATSFGIRLSGSAHVFGKIAVSVEPPPAALADLTPQKILDYFNSGDFARPDDFSDLAILAAMFLNRAELMRAAFEKSAMVTKNGKTVLLAPGASDRAQQKALNLLQPPTRRR